MESNIKLICIDMDGTLLNNNHEVSDRNKEALRKAKELGVNIAIATGRLFCSARYYSDLIGVDTAVIASNGSYVKAKYEDKALLENPMAKEMAIEIYNIVKKYGLSANFNSWDTLLREYPIPENHTYHAMNSLVTEDKRVKFLIDETNFINTIENFGGAILKAIVIEENEDKSNLWAAKKELKDTFGDQLQVVSSGDNNFEVMVGSSSKGNAVAYLAKTLNILPEEVMCIGDSENDLSMIQFAGVGVAMGNGLDLLKQAADYITDTNDNSGVAKAIEHFVLMHNK